MPSDRQQDKASPTERKKIGELLCKSGSIDSDQLSRGLELQKQEGKRIGETLVDLGYLTTEALVEALQQQHQIPAVDLFNLEMSCQAQTLLPQEQMEHYNVIPLYVSGHSVCLAMTDPNAQDMIKELEFRLGCSIRPVVAPSGQVKDVLRALKQNRVRPDRPLRLRDLCHPATETMQEFPPLQELCRQLVQQRASDLVMSAGAPPAIKKNGTLVRLGDHPLRLQQMAEYAQGVMTESQWQEFERCKELDFSFMIEGLGRFRANAFLQRRSVALSIRVINEVIPTLRELGLPAWLSDFALRPNGLILISAPTGHGKSTTVAALVDRINSLRAANIVTIEDPIEYHHRHKLSNVNQREVGVDTNSFPEGLKRVFRQAPDVIVIGEIRDQESAAIAVKAASSGHLVISTVHAKNATTAVERIIDLSPPNHQNQIRTLLADSLLLVLDQRLVPSKDGKEQVLAYEKLINSNRVRGLIREGKVHQVRVLMQQGTEDFHCLDSMLARLCLEGRISKEDGLKHCDSQTFFMDSLKRTPQQPVGRPVSD